MGSYWAEMNSIAPVLPARDVHLPPRRAGSAALEGARHPKRTTARQHVSVFFLLAFTVFAFVFCL